MNSPNVSQPSSEPVGAAPKRSALSAESVAGAKETIKTTARNAAEQIRTAATDTASRVKQQAADYVGQQKQTVADRIGGVSSAIHDSAKSLEEQDPNIAWFTHRAADRLQGLASYVRDQDFATLRNDAESLARRHPAAFFGGLFVAGLVIGNVLKAAQQSSGASSTSYPETDSSDLDEESTSFGTSEAVSGGAFGQSGYATPPAGSGTADTGGVAPGI